MQERGRGHDWVDGLRAGGPAARNRVRDVMRNLQLTPSSDPEPWRARKETLERGHGAERDCGIYPLIKR